MDDLIVIILTLIIAGVGVLGQFKKKKQAQAATEGQADSPKSFWDLITDEAVGNPQATDMDYDELEFDGEEVEVVQKSETLIQKPTYQFKTSNKAELVEKNVNQKTKPKKLKSKLNEDFSLRKAVIYSEILNRKYT